MLTQSQYRECIEAHMNGATMLASMGHFEEATKMIGGLFPMTWEITRPHINFIEKDISGYLPDEYRADINALYMILVVDDEEMEILMVWGRAIDNDGNDILHSDDNQCKFPLITAILDERTLIDYGQYGQRHVTTLKEAVGQADEPLVATTHVQINAEHIDREVEKFSDELDSLLEGWGGGDDSG
jgi:hypothetical protein